MALLTSDALFERVHRDDNVEVYRFPAIRISLWMLGGGLLGAVLLWAGYQVVFDGRPSYDRVPLHVVVFALAAYGTLGGLLIALLVGSLWTHREFVVDLHARTLRMLRRTPLGVHEVSATFEDVVDVRCIPMSPPAYAVQIALRTGQTLELGQGPFERANAVAVRILTLTRMGARDVA